MCKQLCMQGKGLAEFRPLSDTGSDRGTCWLNDILLPQNTFFRRISALDPSKHLIIFQNFKRIDSYLFFREDL